MSGTTHLPKSQDGSYRFGFWGAEQGGRLVEDLAVRKDLLQFGDARVGDLSAVEDEQIRIGQPLEVHQPCVGDLGVF